jgi:hypothetical protein
MQNSGVHTLRVFLAVDIRRNPERGETETKQPSLKLTTTLEVITWFQATVLIDFASSIWGDNTVLGAVPVPQHVVVTNAFRVCLPLRRTHRPWARRIFQAPTDTLRPSC